MMAYALQHPRARYLLDYLRQPSLFGVVGVLNTSVDVAMFWLLTAGLGTAPLPANIISFSSGATNSFLLNGHLTFGDRPGSKLASSRIMRFIAVTVLSLSVSSVSLGLALLLLPTLAAKMVSVASTMLINYLLISRVVFR